MDNFYFENAKKWYSTVHVAPVYHRVFYFLLASIFCTGLYFLYFIYQSTFPLNIKLSMVAKTNHPADQKIFFHKMNYKQPKIGIAEFIIRKAILQRESLDYSNPTTVVENKINLIKNFFADNILQEYEMENLEENEENDLSYAIKGFRKKIRMDNIIFLNDKNIDIRHDLAYKLSLYQETNKAVVFIISCNDLLEICNKYQIFIDFEIKIPEAKGGKIADRIVRFKILSYDKRLIK